MFGTNLMEKFLVPLETPCVYYDDSFLSPEEAEDAYQALLVETKWEKTAKINRWVALHEDYGNGDVSNDMKKVNGHTHASNDESDIFGYKYRDAPGDSHKGYSTTLRRLQQRAQEWYAKYNTDATTSSSPIAPDPSTHDATITDPPSRNNSTTSNNSLNETCLLPLNVCLLNFYQDGQQRIGWHSDREEIGRTTPIVSISLGATRSFMIRSKSDGIHDRATLELTSGSLVLMKHKCQEDYLHSIPKENHVTTGRINVTFRCKSAATTTAGEEEHERRDKWLETIVDGAEPTVEAWSSSANNVYPSEKHLKSTTRTTTNNNDNDALLQHHGATAFGGGVFGDNVKVGKPNDVDCYQIHILVKTNLGAEGYCAAEVQEVLNDIAANDDSPMNAEKDEMYINNEDTAKQKQLQCRWVVIARPRSIMDGYVACCTTSTTSSSDDWDQMKVNDVILHQTMKALLQLKSAHYILKYHTHFQLQDCWMLHSNHNSTNSEQNNKNDDGIPISRAPHLVDGEMLYQYFKQRLENGYVQVLNENSTTTPTAAGGTFRVTCERIGGPHAFRAPEVEREIGGAMAEFYAAKNWIPKMEDNDITVRADVVGNIVIVGTQFNVHDLSKERHFLKFRNAVTIKTNLAYAMVRCANIQPGDQIADPFCGSGTLLLEALEIYQKQLHCIGLDVSRRSADGARENALAEGYGSDVCTFTCSDARGLRRHLEDNSVNAIITNLPWGVMTGHKNGVSDLQTMYEVFLRNSWYVLKDGARIVMLVLRGLQVTRIIRKLSGRYRLLSVNVVRTTNNLPCIIVVEKLAMDDVRESVKGQLAYMSQYVNFSPEMYQAIHMEEIDETH